MIRVAFPLFGGAQWTGGLQYLINLCRVLSIAGSDQIRPLIIAGSDAPVSRLEELRQIPGVEIGVVPPQITRGRGHRLARTVLLGRDDALERWLTALEVDVIFETADFYGWRSRRAALAWIPDLQHRRLPRMFRASGWLRRELGVRAQILSGRTIMLSSGAAENDCLRSYPGSRGQTVVVRFAIPPLLPSPLNQQVLERYRLPERYFYMPNQFWKHKNHLAVIDALALLRSRHSKIVIVSSGSPADPRHPRHFEAVRLRIAELGLSSTFLILGMIPYPDVVELLKGSAAVVNPSLFEGWSTTVEEAKSLGAPLVLSSIDVHREQAGEDALYFDPREPANVAQILEEAWLRFGVPDPLARQQAAAPSASRRTTQFAQDFISAVYLARNSFGRRNSY